MEWQPIETAPKDGTPFLAWGEAVEGFPACWNDRVPRVPNAAVIWWREAWGMADEEVGDGLFRKVPKLSFAYWAPNTQQFRPTHWMPLPVGPKGLAMPKEKKSYPQTAQEAVEEENYFKQMTARDRLHERPSQTAITSENQNGAKTEVTET